MTLLEGIRKTARRHMGRYMGQAPWGGSIRDAEPSPGSIGDMVGSTASSFGAGIGAGRIAKSMGRKMPMPGSMAAFSIGDLGYQATVGAERRRRSAADYGTQLGRMNPHLAHRV